MPELDMVRGIAILLVLFYHGVAPPLNTPLSSGAKLVLDVSQQSWVGVNLFFVLSGFLITGILLDSRARHDYFCRFYFRRALRILPALYAMLLVLLIGGWISWHFLALAALFLANSAPLFQVPLQYPPLWSLAVEEHFYLLWPSLVRRCSVKHLVTILVLICAITPVIRTVGFELIGQRAFFLPFYTWFNLDGLALGALLALWLRQDSFRRWHLKRVALPALITGVGAFALVSGHRMMEAAFSATACDLASIGFLACTLLVGTSRWRVFVDRPILKFLGYISYGLYLVHVLTFRAADILLSRLMWLTAAGALEAMLIRFALGAALSICIAYLSRRSLEEKFLRMGSGSRSALIGAKMAQAQG